MNPENNREKLLLMWHIYTSFLSIVKKLDKPVNKSEDGLTPMQSMVVTTMLLSPKSQTMLVCIAKTLGTTKQNINRILPILERKGYIIKTDLNRKRSIRHEVTEAGRAALIEYVEKNTPDMTGIFDNMTVNEMNTLYELLRKLNIYESFDYLNFTNDVSQYFDEQMPELCDKIVDQYELDNQQSITA